MGVNFNNLSTVKFQQKMKPAALRIYENVFPGCVLEDLREHGVKVHILDKEFGIDSLIKFPTGQWISIQEKYRTYRSYEYCMRTQGYLDFTQEYKNAVGTQYENEGEWFKLGSQLYFYAWANETETDFLKWIIMDIPKYKILVEESGGLENIGYLEQNKKYGKSNFYVIPLEKLETTFLYKGDLF